MHLDRKTSHAGFSLIELMIALLLGLILMAGISQVFVNSQQSYRVTEERSRLQENARFGFEFLTRNIREAGYSGCRAVEQLHIQVIADAPTPSYSTQNIVSGNEATSSTSWAPALVSDLDADVSPETDTISLQKGGSCGATLVGKLTVSQANIQIPADNSCDISAGDVLMLTDCEDAHIFRASSASSGSPQTIAHAANQNSGNHFCLNQAGVGTGSCGDNNAKLYGADSELLTFSSLTYYISIGASGGRALFVYDSTTGSKTELVEGVENMQVKYGVDSNNNDTVDNYQTAEAINTASNWDKVLSADVSLLLKTPKDNLTTAQQTFTYNGAVINAADKRLYHVYSTIINIRNRVQ